MKSLSAHAERHQVPQAEERSGGRFASMPLLPADRRPAPAWR
jgi:hypothetical protein